MAYFELSKGIVLQQYKKAKELADIVSYSSKTNPDVTPILEEETDASFNIHTVEELKRVQDKTRVYFLAQGLDEKTLHYLVEQGINKIIIDNEQDLSTIKEYIKTNNVKLHLMLRSKLKENSIKTERYFVFGMSPEVINKEVAELKHDKNILSLGIHFHRKTQNMAEWNLIEDIQEMFTEETLNTITTFDIGGGLPSVYANTNIKVFDSIYNRIKEIKTFLNEKEIKLMIEPGRFICAPAVKLITTIKLVYEDTIILDASVYNSDTDAFTVPTKLLVENELEKGQGEPYIIKGSTPCSMDLFRYRVYLKEPKQGDTLTFINAGAYNFYCDFCDLEKLETRLVE
jgi:ornithine decarboxylase